MPVLFIAPLGAPGHPLCVLQQSRNGKATIRHRTPQCVALVMLDSQNSVFVGSVPPCTLIYQQVSCFPAVQEAEPPQEAEKPNEEWQHDDPLGEPIHDEMANLLRAQVMEICRGYPPNEQRMVFPGSQPVSLDKTNLNLLQVNIVSHGSTCTTFFFSMSGTYTLFMESESTV